MFFSKQKRPLGTIAAIALLFAAPVALSQSNTVGGIVGSVPAGSKDAVVTVQSDETGLTRSVKPNADGRYSVGSLPTGPYKVTLANAGAASGTYDVTVTVGSNAVVRFDDGQTLAEVQVTASQGTPIIDTSTVESSLTITQEQLQELPVGRSETAVALLAPGVTLGDDGFSGTQGGSATFLPAFGGSSIAENAYYVNGFNVTNFRNGLGGSSIPFEAYQDFQVKTGGYSAEFGRSTGGVINTTTKRGTNSWKFGTSGSYQSKSLRSSLPNVSDTNNDLVIVNNPDRVDNWNLNVEAGGPIWRDHLFVYGLYQFRNETVDNYNLSQLAADKADDPFWLAKVDLRITDQHVLEFTGFSDKNDVTRNTVSNYNPVSGVLAGPSLGLSTLRNGGTNVIAKYTGYLTDSLTASALWGNGKYNRSAIGAGDNCVVAIDARVQPTNIGCSTSADGLVGTKADERTAKRVDFELRLASHQLRFGYDNETNTSSDKQAYSGSAYHRFVRVTPGQVLQGGTVPAGVTELDRIRLYANGGDFEVVSTAYYLEDNWQLNSDLLLSLGLRNETFDNKNSKNATFIKIDNQLAPRLGLAWDVRGDGNSKLYANAGRYYLPVASNTNVRLAGGELFTQTYYRFSGGVNTATGLPGTLGAQLGNVQLFSDGSIKDPRTIVNQNLKPMYQDEYILGYQWKFDDDWSFGVKATYRDLKSGLDDVAVDAALNRKYPGFGAGGFDYYVLTNPGADISMALDIDGDGDLDPVYLSAAELRYPKVKRTYSALELSADKIWDGKWYTKFSYTLGKSQGNTEGYVNSDVEQDDAGITITFDQPGLTEGSNGPLPNDRHHTFKAFGVYQLTPEIKLSTNALAQSGRPINCFGLHPTDPFAAAYGRDSFYCGGQLQPRGSSGRTPWIYQVDVGTAYKPAFLNGALELSLDIFNLFDSRNALQFSEFGETNEGDPDPAYLSVERYQRARQVRLGFNYSFGREPT